MLTEQRERDRRTRLGAAAARGVVMAAVVLSGLSAGFFYTFADTVTRGLAVVDPRTYVLAFQAINDNVRTAPFMVVFAGPAVLLPLSALLRFRADRVSAALMLLASISYILGVVFVTVAVNLPLNQQLGTYTGVDPAGFGAARSAFENRWNAANSVRAAASTAAFVLAASALSVRPERRGGGRRIGTRGGFGPKFFGEPVECG